MKGAKADKIVKSNTAKPADKKTTAAKPAATVHPAELDQLILENITVMTKQLAALTLTVDSHLLKTANIANHVIALEAVLAEVVSMTGLDLVTVNNRIRSRIATAAGEPGSADLAIDLAAYIAAPKPRL